ncbi:hypothetical protein IAD21_01795 [Abditibacteriota bacterium]|nr:hypothetical protein IAD21_01795 [Abditibacteriota bacterium]
MTIIFALLFIVFMVVLLAALVVVLTMQRKRRGNQFDSRSDAEIQAPIASPTKK